MSTTTATGLRRSKRLKSLNVVETEICNQIVTISSDEYNVLRSICPDFYFIDNFEIGEDDDAKGQIRQLTVEGMGRTNDYELPEELGTLSALKFLHVYRFGLTSIPSSIGMLQNLERLNLSDNYIYSPLPDEIGNLKNLTDLNLSENEITDLPTSIGNLNLLKELILNHNPLSSLPTSIGNLKNLNKLNLTGTSISCLPASVGNLEKLDILDIAKIPALKQLPEDLFNLSALRCVTVSGDSLLQGFENLIGLRMLIIRGPETSYNLSSIEHLQQLEILWLDKLTTEFDVRQLSVVRKLPNIRGLWILSSGLFSPLFSAQDLTSSDLRFLLDLVLDTSIGVLDDAIERAKIPQITYALACNNFKFHTPFSGSNEKILPLLNKLWPRMLSNACHACKHWKTWRGCGPEQHDAIYILLSEGMSFFVEMLQARSSEKSKK